MALQKIARVLGLIGVIIVITAAIIASFNQKTPNSEKVWDKETVLGDLDAENYFIIYSDIVCPYCVAFENAMIANKEELMDYIEKNNVMIEIRVSDFLYEYGQSNPMSSRYSAEAVFCAKKEGKFWDYYDHVITTVWDKYFKAMGKSAFTALEQNGKDFWIKLGKEVGLSDTFEKCVKNNESLPEVMDRAAKTEKMIDGMPYFKFNSYVASGFDMNWGWEYVKMYFDTGLKSK